MTLIHRRNTLRAEQALQDRLPKENINMLLNRGVEEILGDSMVTGIRLKNNETGEMEDHEFQGIFISVGEIPNTDLAVSLGVELQESGYIKVDSKMRTNIRMVYAAGDVTGGLRQVITAAAEGAIAAISSYDDIKNPYWS